MRPFLPFATLLGTAFLLGCQEQPSSPVGPEGPQFDMSGSVCAGHCPHSDQDDETKFKVTLQALTDCDPDVVGNQACDVTGGGFLLGPHGGKKGLQQQHNVNVTLNLLSSFRGKVTGGANCFGTETFLSGMQIRQQKPRDPTNANIQFFFDAKDKITGTTPINYVLQLLDGAITGGTWPAVGGASTIAGGKFNLGHSNGQGNKDGCKATEVALLFSIKVERCGGGVICPMPF